MISFSKKYVFWLLLLLLFKNYYSSINVFIAIKQIILTIKDIYPNIFLLFYICLKLFLITFISTILFWHHLYFLFIRYKLLLFWRSNLPLNFIFSEIWSWDQVSYIKKLSRLIYILFTLSLTFQRQMLCYTTSMIHTLSC